VWLAEGGVAELPCLGVGFFVLRASARLAPRSTPSASVCSVCISCDQHLVPFAVVGVINLTSGVWPFI
jgi:hypothetical protein